MSGTVTAFEWTNPHVYIELDVPDEKGVVKHWSVELGSPSILMQAGWKFTDVKVGDKITVVLSPLRSGEAGGLLAQATLRDGRVLGNGPGPCRGTAVSSACSGGSNRTAPYWCCSCCWRGHAQAQTPPDLSGAWAPYRARPRRRPEAESASADAHRAEAAVREAVRGAARGRRRSHQAGRAARHGRGAVRAVWISANDGGRAVSGGDHPASVADHHHHRGVQRSAARLHEPAAAADRRGASGLLRPLGGEVGRRHAGRRYGRHQGVRARAIRTRRTAARCGSPSGFVW